MKKNLPLAFAICLLIACENTPKKDIVATSVDTVKSDSLVISVREAPFSVQTLNDALLSNGYEIIKDNIDDSKRFPKYLEHFAKREHADFGSCDFIKVTKFLFGKKGQNLKNDTRYLSTGLNKLTGVVLVRDIELASASQCDSCFNKVSKAFNRDLFPVGSAYRKDNHIYYIEAENQNDTPNYIQVDSIIKATVMHK